MFGDDFSGIEDLFNQLAGRRMVGSNYRAKSADVSLIGTVEDNKKKILIFDFSGKRILSVKIKDNLEIDEYGEETFSGEKILKIHTAKVPLDKSVDIAKLAEETEGYTGADIESLVREAAMLALRENMDASKVTKKHFEKAMEKVTPSVSKNDQERYKQIEQKYLRSAKAALANTGATYAG